MRTAIDESILPSLVGKKIKWDAPIYSGNLGHYGYGLDGGIFILKGIDITKRCPIVEVEIIEGANPIYIFVETYGTDHVLCYTDSDRFVSFEYED